MTRATLTLLLLVAACGGRLPETRFYQLAAPHPHAPRAGGDLVIALEPLETAPGYDDDRIVYRTTPYRLDYYHYHRWSASPGVMASAVLEEALEHSGQVAAVVRDPSERTPVLVRGRVLAIEELDESQKRWLGRLALELTVVDARTGTLLASERFDETEPLPTRDPEGLARALSIAMGRISSRATTLILDHASRLIAHPHPAHCRISRVDALAPFPEHASGASVAEDGASTDSHVALRRDCRMGDRRVRPVAAGWTRRRR
ncbi:MAG: membrane integrity-associated transporter subunit PqiC [Deltaproteobacteria bacterium]|nr:membrane integrity-associated transporter subunit PqiC [Deltaproteobacteria bacterium]